MPSPPEDEAPAPEEEDPRMDPETLALMHRLQQLPAVVAAALHAWKEQDIAVSVVVQRQVFNAAMDLYDVLLLLGREFSPDPDQTAPPIPRATPPDSFGDEPLPEEGDYGRVLRNLAWHLRDVAERGRGAIRSWRQGLALSETVIAALPPAAQALLKPMEELYTEFNDGAVQADEDDKERLRAEEKQEAARQATIRQQIYLGSSGVPRAWSHAAWCAETGRGIAIGRDRGQVIVSTGIPDMGKSQLALTQFEAALNPRPGLASDFMPPTAVVAFHVDLSGTGLPGLLAAIFPNPREADAQVLAQRLGVLPAGLPRVNLAVPGALLAEYAQMLHAAFGPTWPEGFRLLALKVPLWQLGLRGLEVLLGADQDAAYVQELLDQAQRLGNQLTGARWQDLIEKSTKLLPRQKQMALARLQPLLEIEAAEGDLWDLVEPGTLTIVALAGRWISRSVALPTNAALMNGMAQHSERHGAFQRFYCLDEVSELEGDARLWESIVTAARQVRHWSNTLWIAGQDLMGLPDQLLGLVTICVVFCLRSGKVYEALRKRLAGLGRWTLKRVSRLRQGEAILVTTASSDAEVAARGIRVWTRPPACAHGGHTKMVF